MGIFSLKAQKVVSSVESIYDISIDAIDGSKINLAKFKGKKILFINVASKCGFTKQYDGLQELHEAYGDKVVLIGCPSNDFGAQEPGSEKEIQEFCRLNFGVSFLMTEKIHVKSDKIHPLYKWLTEKSKNGRSNSSVKWNFQKYLVDEQGRLIDVFYSLTKPMDKKIIKLLL